VGGFFFAVDYGDFYVFEAGVTEEAAYFGFGEAEPDVGVHVAGFLIIVAEEVENYYAASRLQNPVGFPYRLLRMLGVVQGLAEEG